MVSQLSIRTYDLFKAFDYSDSNIKSGTMRYNNKIIERAILTKKPSAKETKLLVKRHMVQIVSTFKNIDSMTCSL